ncbi:hypothetical protein [Streptomyces sp. Z26]|uniref:hypothetical protein n=1 Tax=Streptomyces sp. Z26 TaxID=2500177 RepID=UPI000EF14FA9|nr:hypothetical protein [Streptomyces sp. Z26]RLL68392.1 hypothetical protein D7M15_17895 [Streptomyces sp. Z26]
MSDYLEVLEGGPEWLPLAAAVAVVLPSLVFMALAVARLRRSWLSGIGAQAVVALGGVAVSVHGLWGFATGTAGLHPGLAAAFIGVFDAAEIVLLVMLYRAADPEVGWTPELRLMHRTAWTLVAFSGAMNAVHAPNWWARPVLAAVPALATWLIELQLRSKLGGGVGEVQEEPGGRPGPVRLAVLVWQHAWSGLFALLGLDTRTSSTALARAAMVQRAALRVYRLRLALETGARSRRVRKLRRRAQTALDRADVATDPAQSLALARRLAALVRADEVALLDYADTTAVLAMVEDLSVTDAAHTAAAVSRAEEAEAARQRAESARQEAEAARHRATEETDAAHAKLKTLREEKVAARESADAARQRATDARNEEKAARQAETDTQRRAREDVEALQTRAGQLRTLVEEWEGRSTRAREQAEQAEAALSQLTARTEEAALVHGRLLGDLAQHAPDHDSHVLVGGGRLFQSDAKQAGWDHYRERLDASGGQDEPSAAELADQYGVNAGNARNWLRDFRAARAAQLTAHPPRAAARTVDSVAV